MPFVPDKQLPDSQIKSVQPSSGFVPDKEQPGMLENAVNAWQALHGGLVKGATLGNIDPSNIPVLKGLVGPAMQDHPYMAGAGQLAGGAASGALLGAGASALAPEMAASLPGVLPEGLRQAAGSLGANTLAGGAQGALTSPGEDGSRLGQAVAGGGLSALLQPLAASMGSIGGKLGDYLMRKAVGGKVGPGMGTALLNQGVGGTKAGMLSQVKNKLPQAESELQDLVGGLDNKVSSSSLADAVRSRAGKFTNPETSGPLYDVKPEYAQVHGKASELDQLGNLSPRELLALKRSGDYKSYTASGNPATSLESELGRAQADAARSQLDQISGGGVPEALSREQALIGARKGLSKPDSLNDSIFTKGLMNSIPGSGIGLSSAARAADSTSQLGSPETLQSLLGALFQSKNQGQ